MIGRSNILRTLLSLCFSLLTLLILFSLLYQKHNPGQWPDLGAILGATDADLLLAFSGLYLLTLFARAWRYQVLLSCAGASQVPSYSQMLLVTAVRNMLVDVLPARIGELSFVGLLNRLHGVSIANGLSALSVSLAFDFVALSFLALGFILMAALSAQFDLAGSQIWLLAWFGFVLALAVVSFFWLFVLVPWVSKRLWLGKRSSSASAKQKCFILWLHSFSNSLLSIRRANKSMLLIALSLLIRGLKYLGLCTLFFAVAKNSFPEIAALANTTILVALVGGEFATSLPIPNFMGFGLYEASGVAVFHIMGVVDSVATAVTLLCSHIVSQLLEYSIGGVALAILLAKKKRRKPAISDFS